MATGSEQQSSELAAEKSAEKAAEAQPGAAVDPRRRTPPGHPRGPAHAAPRHRPRRDQGVARVVRRDGRRPGPQPRALRDAAAARAGPRAERRRAGAAQHRLHQHDPAGARAVVPRRRGHRAPDPRLPALERRRHRLDGQPQGPRGRRAHRDVPVLGLALRGRLQPLLPRQGPRGRRRPDLHPGPRLPRHLRPGLPRGPARRDAAVAVPPGGAARRRQGPLVVPAPAADAGLLGVPDRVDGPHRPQRDLPGPVQPLHEQPRHQGHQPAARLGVPRRRRDGRARVARRHRRRGPRGARQPHLRRQLQPAAARRPGARQRQDHPGARVHLPGRGLERHQGRLGPRVGRPARPRRRRRAGQQDEQHPRRAVPDLLGRERRLHPRQLLRRRPAAAQDGRAHVRRADREAAARRPRLPQGLLGVRRGHQARRPADGDPGAHHQGLDDRRPRGQERHAPDEEADQGRPQEVPRPALPADQRQGDRRVRDRAVLPPRQGLPGDRVHARAPARPRRVAAQARGARQAAQAARRRGLLRAQGRAPASRPSPPRWRWSGCCAT